MSDNDTQDVTVDAVPVRTRDDRGRFIGPPGTGRQITAQNASEYARRRWEKAQLAVSERVTAAAKAVAPGVRDPFDAWALVNERHWQQIMDSDTPRGDDVRELGRNMGMVPRADELAAAHGAGQAAGAVASAAALLQLVELLGKAGQEDDEEDV